MKCTFSTTGEMSFIGFRVDGKVYYMDVQDWPGKVTSKLWEEVCNTFHMYGVGYVNGHEATYYPSRKATLVCPP